MKLKKIFLLAVLAITLAFVVAPAGADTMIYLQGVNFPSSIFATVEFDYAFTSDIAGQITLDVSNTSLITSALTGFAFNAPSAVTGATSASAPTGWNVVYNPDAINSPGNFGFFDIAEITGPNLNGGSPQYGIWNGTGSVEFVINVTGTAGMSGLTDANFLSLLSDLTNGQTSQQYFIARFQALPEGGSDVAIPGVPIPPSALLLGSGLIGLVGLGWRRRKNDKV